MSFEWAGLYTPTLLTSVSKALKTMLATQNQLILANISHLWAIQNKTKQKVQSSKSVWRSLLLYHPWERNLFGSPMICLSPSVRLKFFPEDTFFSLDAEKQTKEASERRVLISWRKSVMRMLSEAWRLESKTSIKSRHCQSHRRGEMSAAAPREWPYLNGNKRAWHLAIS